MRFAFRRRSSSLGCFGGSGARLLPLLGRLALGAPSVDGGDLVAQRGVDGAVALQAVLAGEDGGHDQRREGLAAAACLFSWGLQVSFCPR